MIVTLEDAAADPRQTIAELEQRLRELATERDEALEKQTATAEILRVISGSPTDLQPTFDAIAARATVLCGAVAGVVFRFDGSLIHFGAGYGVTKDETDDVRAVFPLPPGRGSATARAILTRDIVHIHDPAADPDFAQARLARFGAILSIPMLRDGKPLGAITVTRQRVEPFAQAQIDLLKTFADQAVIAIENVRLFNELRSRTNDLQESLDRQTATAEVLSVISSSPGQLQPVFEKLLECALRLCHAHMGTIARAVDGAFTHAASSSGAAANASIATLNNYRPPPNSPLGRMLATKATVQVPDYADTEAYAERAPGVVALVELGRARAALQVPLLKDGEVVGGMTIYRPEVRPFDDKDVALVENFAKQAVIAIENARLLSELRERTDNLQESLEYQTATSDVLKVISRSTFDLQPVLDTLIQTAARLCNSNSGGLTIRDGDVYRYRAVCGTRDEYAAFLKRRPFVPGRDTTAGRVALEGKVVHIEDITADPDYAMPEASTVGNMRTLLGVPLLREGVVIGTLTLARHRVEPFTERQIELVRTFADQAVIAIENARLLTELREALRQQIATADVLEIISRSAFDLQPVFDAVAERSVRLCEADRAFIFRYDGELLRMAAAFNAAPEFKEWVAQNPIRPGRDSGSARAALERRTIHIPDVLADPEYSYGAKNVEGIRTILGVPILRGDELLGVIMIYRLEVRPFTDKQIALVETFAAQSVIAIENARLLTELRERTTDLQQSLEYQTATSDVLKVISRTTFDLTPVLQYVLETAMRLCRTHGGSIFRLEGAIYRWAVGKGLDPVYEDIERNTPIAPDEGTVVGRAALRRQTVQIVDAWNDPLYAQKESARITLARTMMGVPLLREGVPIGVIAMARNTVEPFSDSEIELVTTFADQAVIAIENARLLNELQSRQAELRVTFDNMGDAVIMFDGAQRLVAWNRNFQQMLDITDDFLATPRTYAEFVAYLTARGEFAVSAPPDVGLGEEGEVRPIRYERTRPDGRVLEVRRNPVPGGGFVFIYADITERKRAEEGLHAAREAAENALADLKAVQANLIQAEKMASLGQLTAGIAHEIKNPLNFVNNFADLSNELLGELKETATPAFAALDENKRAEIEETIDLLAGNLEKIAEHGRRADGIVKSMLAHSRGGTGERRGADINALVEESLNLAYHGARAQDQNFNITLERDYDQKLGPIELVPQDITRVFLNLCGNGFYAANKRRRDGEAVFRPVLKVATRDLGDAVEVRIRDNGIGIPPEVKAKLFQPFFTTKPTGEGTGLGLSISYDIVTQQHGGTIDVDSRVGDFTEFTIRLPRNRRTASRGPS